ncbi:hypothetical protein [Nocardia shimofusensis]|uniref:hypothetical protein n=1 Tax=Nocardia shimofusensis TaxID=228596 RepID=UPI00082D53A3|nr:hypothetical protein [Nocardia shimofusensis]
MQSSIHRSAAWRRDAVARLRGGSAGAVSGAVSIAAHGWAAATAAPGSSTLALLAAASAVVGALVAGIGPLRDTTSGLVAALIAGQLLGHVTLGFGSGHPQHGADPMSWQMLVAHLLAALFAAIVIRGAEAAYRIGTTVLARVLPLRRELPVHVEPVPLRTRYRDRVILRVFAARALRTRAPPRPVFA